MFEIRVIDEFSSAHNLREYRGRCEELHGHNWKVEVVICGSKLDKTGMLLDFKNLKSQLNGVLDTLDHKYLNDIDCFKKINPVRNNDSLKEESGISNGVNPTSENIAKFIYDKLKPGLEGLKTVTVWESSDSSATYYSEEKTE